MYVTKSLSMLKKSPPSLSSPPPEGPNSGILVIQDERPTCCFGLCKDDQLKKLPFPQNKNLTTFFTTSNGTGAVVINNPVILIPVLDQPLSSNQYYAIQPRGKHKGEAFTNSKEEDKATCCCCSFVSDKKPQPFDPDNIYQQIEICAQKRGGGFFAKSVVPDGFPPDFLRRKGWGMTAETSDDFELSEATGLDSTLRARLPDFNFPLPNKVSKPVVVGKWYCPFIFIKESSLKQQIKNSMYYELALEQRWEQIFASENSHSRENGVVVDVVVPTEVVSFGGVEGVPDEKNVVDGMMWFKSSINAGGELSVGLRTLIIERMKWEEERFGWVVGNEKQVRVKKVEEFGGVGEWRNFGCYVLVERFKLKRMDGSLVLTYDFKHTHQIRSKWE
ncbi:hypothetical protein Pint_23391 [Pistacia integerrima]|uniref:Uncharacterized protein n=1 Tax=Pistacia integerrima TaxID=434235 RepID=A0ACC0YNS7_9ROSI|nr:hypothetical protein Pint_23391 [Pistacia integerrima]